jgi:hypothetical protein
VEDVGRQGIVCHNWLRSLLRCGWDGGHYPKQARVLRAKETEVLGKKQPGKPKPLPFVPSGVHGPQGPGAD